MMTRQLGIVIVAGSWLALCAAASVSAPPTLAGITIGSSVLDAEKRFGFPQVAQTTDFGSFWQWSDRDGLDREVYAGDDLIVQSVLVAPARAGSTAQPSEAPLLGLDIAKAAAAAATAGAGPMILKPSVAGTTVWRFGSGYLTAESDGKAIVRLRALDVATAQQWGYAGAPLASPSHTAAAMVQEVISHPLPDGEGEDLILVSLDASGHVTDTKVIVSSGQTAVDDFAMQCARRSIFKPATCAGVPCAGTYIYSGGITH
jgi:TonB family protein